MTLIPEKLEIGAFKGFSESGLELKAEVIAPFSEYNPRIGDFILVEVTPENAIVGRITRFFPEGILSSSHGDEYLAAMSRRRTTIPSDVREEKLRYNVSMKLLGSFKKQKDGKPMFTPSIRTLPHLGARVGRPDIDVVSFLCRLGGSESCRNGGNPGVTDAEIGHFVLGDQMTYMNQKIPTFFDVKNLIAKRTFVFAKAGFGKSNFIKLLITKLYEKEQRAGMLIFDPEGEYAFPTEKGPALFNIPEIRKKLVVYTNRRISSPMKDWVAGNIKINMAEIKPSVAVRHFLPAGKQETNFANALRGTTQTDWSELVRLFMQDGFRVDREVVKNLVGGFGQEVSIDALIYNFVPIVRRFHSEESELVEEVKHHLLHGRVVVMDISTISSKDGNELMGLLLSDIFYHNQTNFVSGQEGGRELMDVIAVIEEAQSVLPLNISETNPMVEWVKEGRKYGLGSILVTQQPGAIAEELVSQGDNFFVFHLLSQTDVRSLQKHNAHYSDDVLSAIIHEPIIGNAFFWSAPLQPFVMSCRVGKFEDYVKPVEFEKIEPSHSPVGTYESESKNRKNEFNEIVMKTICEVAQCKIYKNVWVNEKPRTDVMAIDKWNLLFTIAANIDPNSEVAEYYCDTFPGGSTAFCKEEAVISVLEQKNILAIPVSATKRMAGKDKEFYLLKIEACKPLIKENKKLTDEKLVLNVDNFEGSTPNYEKKS